MNKMRLSQGDIKKIAIFRALQLGDMLCSIPAVRALRHSYPDAEITLLGLPWASILVNRFPNYFNFFKHFPGYPGLPEQKFDPGLFLWFLSYVQHECYDLVLQMQGDGSIVNPMIQLFGATHSAGFYINNDYCPDQNLFLPYPTGIHEIERHLKLMVHLGVANCGTQLEFPLKAEDHYEFNHLDIPVEPGKYICVHPGSRGESRRWPAEDFAQIADYCASKGFSVVLTGTADELEIVHSVESEMRSKPVIAAGKTTLGAAAILIRNALALISNCTGVSHLAAALKTPSVVISMDGEPERWAPLDKELHRTIDWTKDPRYDSVFQQVEIIISKGKQVRC